jgi:hypothetical protein
LFTVLFAALIYRFALLVEAIGRSIEALVRWAKRG